MDEERGRRRQDRAPTIRDVARSADVSKSLVSLVLRGDPGVSPERRSAVHQAMDELGYEPNRVARALAGNGTGAVGILINDIRNPWYVDLLDGLSSAFEPAGVAPLLVDSASNQRVGRSSVQILSRQRVDGIVALGTSDEVVDLAALRGRTPVVLAGTYDPEELGADVVANDDVAGARLATEHLITLGHRRILCLRGPQRVGALREEGYRRAMVEAGLGAEVEVVDAGMTEESGYAATLRVLRMRTAPTALIAYNDLLALGALAAAADLGLSVPGDVSLVGYDDTYLAGIRRVSLTTIQNGSFQIGRKAAEFLLQRIDGYTGPGRLHEVPTVLEVRQTTGPAPARPAAD